MSEDLVSIVMPSHNSSGYIGQSIESVKKQTYQNWELLIVDDVSDDDTLEIVKGYMANDQRIKLFPMKERGGASIARNFAIRKAEGKYIAFLDSDDLWDENKLTKQVYYMKENGFAFTYTNYFQIRGSDVIKNVTSPKEITYKKMLQRNWIGCLTVMYDQSKVGVIQIPKIDKRNDYALWLLILRKVNKGYLLDEKLAYYRLNNGVSKGNKAILIKYHYYLFKEILNLSLTKSIYYTICNVYNYIKEKI